MPPLVVPSALQVLVTGACVDRPWSNVYGVTIIDPDPLDVDQADDVSAWFHDYYVALEPLRSSLWSVDSITVTDIREEGGPQFVVPQTGVVGTGSANALPPDMAICTTWLTNRRGGSYRGRTYHTGFTEEGMTAGRLGPDEVADELAAASSFLAASPAGFELGVISRTLLEINLVTLARVNDVYDHQTRRRFPQ